MDDLPERIGPYDVRDRLGHGGMGVVYLGYDPALDRPVAIKVLKVPDEETRRRFLREARLAARVHHPHIVSIYAVGEHEGNPYLAMEFIAGRTMAQIIRSGEEVPLARKVHWLAELCAGLGHAHQSGIVHRDVKPSNLLITQSSGSLRLLDFGIAHGNEASNMTMAGMIVGTPQYMSPEQIQGHAVDARSDIFSVGAVAYELLTGRQAFGGENLYHVSRQIVSEQPRPIESFVPDAPAVLLRTIAKCLQKDPATRPDNARQLEREFLAIARRLDPDQTLVVLAPEATMVEAHDHTTSRQALLREAEQAIQQGELTVASGLIQKLEASAPGTEVQQLRQRLQSRRVDIRVQTAVSRAEEAVQAGTTEEAEQALDALVEIAPRHPELDRLRTALQARIDARQVATLVSRARQALQHDRLEEAEALVAEALALAPDAREALSVQQMLLDRTRAQRIARLVAQASRAIEQEDAAAARRALDALVKIDPSHRDVARLQGRLQALSADIGDAPGPETPAPMPPVPIKPVPVARTAAPALVSIVTTGRDGARAEAGSTAATPAPAPPTAPAARKVEPVPASPHPIRAEAGPARPSPHQEPLASPAADVVLRAPSGPGDESTEERTRPAIGPVAEPEAETRPARSLVPLVVVAALLAALGGGAYFALVKPDAAVTPATGSPTTSTTADAASAAGGVGVEPSASAGAPDPPVAPPSPAPPPSAADTSASAAPAAEPATPRGDPWQGVRQLAARGAFDRALVAVDQVSGVSSADQQAERMRIVENARRNALAARRGAEDMRLTRSPQYVLGMTRQAEADRQRDAGRLRTAVSLYVESRAHYLQAFTDSGRAPAPTVVAPPAAEPAPPAAPPTAPAPASAPAGAPAEARPNLSTWSNEEARAAIAQFCGAYLARDMGGISRLWPNMGPEWRSELRDAFATSGELVCVFENVTIVRTSEEFSATARLLTQLPGGEQRRRGLVISLVPARDRLVIGNIRVR